MTDRTDYDELLASHERLLAALEAVILQLEMAQPAGDWDSMPQARDAIIQARKVRTG